MTSDELSAECQQLLLYFSSVSTSPDGRWEWISETAACLEIPIEKVRPRIDELVAKRLLERRSRVAVMITSEGRRLAKQIRTQADRQDFK